MGFEGTLPPWVFAQNWSAAAAIVEKLLGGDPAELDRMQARVLEWWKQITNNVDTRIFEALRKRRREILHDHEHRLLVRRTRQHDGGGNETSSSTSFDEGSLIARLVNAFWEGRMNQ